MSGSSGEAAAVGLRVERDPAGNLWACPDAPGPWWGVGSHLDSVRSGGAYDGALGVAVGFAVARAQRRSCGGDLVRRRGGRALQHADLRLAGAGGQPRPGGAGSHRRRRRAPRRGDARGGRRSGRARRAPPSGSAALRGFLELHIDQSREVFDLGVPGGRRLAARGAHARARRDRAGAPTTPAPRRWPTARDALAAAGRADRRRRPHVEHPVRATATRIEVEPNAQSTIPARVRLWLDARAPTPADLDAWLAGLERRRLDRPPSVPVGPVRSRSACSRARMGSSSTPSEGALGRPAATRRRGREVVCFAGHDAGILAERIPAGMVLVRNERGDQPRARRARRARRRRGGAEAHRRARWRRWRDPDRDDPRDGQRPLARVPARPARRRRAAVAAHARRLLELARA